MSKIGFTPARPTQVAGSGVTPPTFSGGVSSGNLQPVSGESNWMIEMAHGLDTMYPEVRVWDAEHFPLVPNEIVVLDSNNIEIRFVEPQVGTIVIYKVV